MECSKMVKIAYKISIWREEFIEIASLLIVVNSFTMNQEDYTCVLNVLKDLYGTGKQCVVHFVWPVSKQRKLLGTWTAATVTDLKQAFKI